MSTLVIRTKSGVPIANGFTRVVRGGRGDYVEFTTAQIALDSLHIPEGTEWRQNSKVAYYAEYRTADNVMVYFQRRIVAYADYKIGMWYVSPADLEKGAT